MVTLAFAASFDRPAVAYRVEAEQHRATQEAAVRDALTGVANRRAFNERLDHLVANAPLSGQAFGLVMADTDHFKAFNDTHGHAAGDDALRSLAATLTRQAGPDDLVARIGGDEFAMLVVDVNDDAVVTRVRMLQRAIDATCAIRASVGGAAWTPDVRCARDMLALADDQLYASKRDRHAKLRAIERTERFA